VPGRGLGVAPDRLRHVVDGQVAGRRIAGAAQHAAGGDGTLLMRQHQFLGRRIPAQCLRQHFPIVGGEALRGLQIGIGVGRVGQAVLFRGRGNELR
jgi:hypothetical protein